MTPARVVWAVLVLGGAVASCDPASRTASSSGGSTGTVVDTEAGDPSEDSPADVDHWSVSPTTVDLGLVGAEEERELEFRLLNSGELPLRIAEIRSSCGCLRVMYDRVEVAPGEEQVVQVRFTTDGRTSHQYTLTFRVRQATVRESVVALRYTPKPKLRTEPPAIHFGYRRVGEATKRTLTARASIPAGEVDREIQFELPGDAPLTVEPLFADPAESGRDLRAELQLTLDTSASGVIDTRLKLWTTQCDPVVVRLQGVVHRGLYFEARSAHFGRVAPGEARRRELWLHGESAALGSAEVSCEPEWVRVELQDLESEAERRSLRLRCVPPADTPPGRHDGVLRVRWPDTEEPLELRLHVDVVAP